jgi:hypothetical protein
MKKPLLVLAAVLCVSAISGQAEAFCGDPAQGCSQAFSNGALNPQAGTTNSQGFGFQPERQWSGNSTRFGNFTLYGGVSQGDVWNQSRFGDRFDNSAGANSHSQSSNGYCELYGTCKPLP